jgi:membrane-associated phospholipid phosphatase
MRVISCIVLLALGFALPVSAGGGGLSERLLRGSSPGREALELGVVTGLVGFQLASLRDMTVWPEKPRLETTQRDEIPGTTVSVNELALATAVVGAGIGLIPNREGWFNHVSYRHAKGFVEATAVLTPLFTEIAKLSTGKKRPGHDAALAQDPGMSAGERKELRKSFWSGHSAVAFSAATYGNLFLFGQIADNSRPSLAWKAPLALGLYGLAGYVAHSRVDDNEHDTLDVTIGALAGGLTALFVYALHDNRLGSIYGDAPRGRADRREPRRDEGFRLRLASNGIGVYRSF